MAQAGKFWFSKMEEAEAGDDKKTEEKKPKQQGPYCRSFIKVFGLVPQIHDPFQAKPCVLYEFHVTER